MIFLILYTLVAYGMNTLYSRRSTELLSSVGDNAFDKAESDQPPLLEIFRWKIFRGTTLISQLSGHRNLGEIRKMLEIRTNILASVVTRWSHITSHTTY
ncbi:hypothetical protein K469DRAFT_337291 [Zopfia rhizophila CBS 207.26]|uniref:Uncharacterized protein n=1 Tax=Zopfia rhizophila CBS 207.26 TaxID=1314779 RepID=A0A6A6DIW5_9PEZI|nr:hypothetical protein K469DRAFT_337291 [Zopfia rhizophila CBS 207.26]